jgi:hypothetical protein
MLSPSIMIACDASQFLEPDISVNYNDVIDLVQRAVHEFGCHGNYISNTLVYLHLYGTCTMDCTPYSTNLSLQDQAYRRTNYGYKTSFYQSRGLRFNADEPTISCIDYTSNVGYPLGSGSCNGRVIGNNENLYFEPPRMFRTLFSYKLTSTDQASIMKDIIQWGPILTSFTVYSDFYDFDPLENNNENVYTKSSLATVVGGHAVLISGWGTTSTGIPFWWIKNSWGGDYGKNGYFKMKRGNDECGIETNVVGIMPNIFPKNELELQRFLTCLYHHHGFRKKQDSIFPIILQTFLKKYSITLSQPIQNLIFNYDLCQTYPIVDFFFFHIRYPMLFHLDPSTGYNVRYLKNLVGLNLQWTHVLPHHLNR